MSGTPGRFERSWRLIKASAAVLGSDRELLVLPVISGIASLIVAAMFAAGLYSTGTFETMEQRGSQNFAFYVWLFAFYVVQYFIIIYFNTALVGAAIERLGGGDPTLASALALANSRLGPILGYAILSATVGVILRAIAERFGFIGRIVIGLIGFAWTVATFLVVPILAAEGVGPFEAVKQSAALLKKTWGENLIGNAGISVITGLAAVAIGFVGFGGGAVLVQGGNPALGVPLIAIAIVLFLGLIIFGAALSAVYAAAVYWYAAKGVAPPGFDDGLIRGAFSHKA